MIMVKLLDKLEIELSPDEAEDLPYYGALTWPVRSYDYSEILAENLAEFRKTR